MLLLLNGGHLHCKFVISDLACTSKLSGDIPNDNLCCMSFVMVLDC